MSQFVDSTFDICDTDKAEEARYTKELLNHLKNCPDQFEDRSSGAYYKFYSKNNNAGYAFHILYLIFKKIDERLGINVTLQDPWTYFHDHYSLLKFYQILQHLLERAFRGEIEHQLIEKIRLLEKGRKFRDFMEKRITDLDPSQRTFEPEVLEFLRRRNYAFNSFANEVYKARNKILKHNTAGLRHRNTLLPVELDGGTELTILSPVKLHLGMNPALANLSEVGPAEITHTESPAASRFTTYFQTFFHGGFGTSHVRRNYGKPIREFSGSTLTVVTITIICIMATTSLASLSLFISLSNPAQSKATRSDFFTGLQQTILLFYAQYVLITPWLRGLQHNNERFWFLASMVLCTLTTVASLCVCSWNLPVSTFLGYVASISMVAATLFLIQENSFNHPVKPDPSSRESSEPC